MATKPPSGGPSVSTTKDPAINKQYSPFERLAPELRNQIYHEAVNDYVHGTVALTTSDPDCLAPVPLALARTCRMFRQDLLSIFFAGRDRFHESAAKLVINVSLEKIVPVATIFGDMTWSYSAKTSFFKFCAPANMGTQEVISRLTWWTYLFADMRPDTAQKFEFKITFDNAARNLDCKALHTFATEEWLDFDCCFSRPDEECRKGCEKMRFLDVLVEAIKDAEQKSHGVQSSA